MNDYTSKTNETYITVDIRRYDDLIRAEMKLRLLENAIEDKSGYADVEDIKKMFKIGGDFNDD